MVFLPIHWRETEAQIQGGLVKSLQFRGTKPGMLVHAYYLRARAAEAGGLPPARGQFEIHSEFQTSLKYRTKRLCEKKKRGGGGGNENISRSRLEVFHQGKLLRAATPLPMYTPTTKQLDTSEFPALRLTLPDTCLCVGVWDLHRYACHVVTKMLGTHTHHRCRNQYTLQHGGLSEHTLCGRYITVMSS